jgi:N-acetylmuramoyl-L-alanine amidase
MRINFHESPNSGERRRRKIQFVICHQTAATNFESTRTWFMNPESERSAHYVIDLNGDVHAFVPEHRTAWHCKNWNSSSIGVEFVGLRQTVTPEQERSAVILFNQLRSKYKDIRFVEHREMPGAKTECPSKLFEPWGGVRKWLDTKLNQSVYTGPTNGGPTLETTHDTSPRSSGAP